MVGFWAYFAAAMIGAVVGAAELVSRHSDRPLRSLLVDWGIFYLVLNAMFSILAIFLIDVLRPDWISWPTAGELMIVGSAAWLQVVVAAGLGAAAVFRSGIMKVRGADGDVTLGPGAVVDVFLKMTDDAVDRRLGVWRIEYVGETMSSVDFDQAKTLLPPYCFGALKRVSAEQQADFARQLAALDGAPGDKSTKAELLGLALIGVVGPEIVLKAVARLGDRITVKEPPVPPDPVPPPAPPGPVPVPGPP